jgi:hypothetical protein
MPCFYLLCYLFIFCHFQFLMGRLCIWIVRLCVRRNFPNFLFSQVLEMFGCRSLEIFQKKTEFSNSQNFCKNVWKKVQENFVKVWKQGFPNIQKFWKLFYSENSKNYKKMMLNSNFGNRKKLVPTQNLTQKFG